MIVLFMVVSFIVGCGFFTFFQSLFLALSLRIFGLSLPVGDKFF